MKKFSLIALASLPLLMVSCLKDKKIDDKEYGIDGITDVKIIELHTPTNHLNSYALDFVDRDTTFDIIEVRLAANEPATEDINVQLTLANSSGIIGAYNDDNGTHFAEFPANLYSLLDPGLNVTIPKGSRSAFVKIGLNPFDFDPSSTYALGFKIASVTQKGYTISGNFGEGLTSFGAKNKYDGRYKAKGYGFLGGNTTAPYLFSVDCDWELDVITTGESSVYMNAQPLFRGGAIIYFSNVFPKFIFNPTTNKVTGMANDAPGNGISFQFPVDGGTYDSRYDPSSKTIYVRFGLNNSATWRVVDTLTYCGPR